VGLQDLGKEVKFLLGNKKTAGDNREIESHGTENSKNVVRLEKDSLTTSGPAGKNKRGHI